MRARVRIRGNSSLENNASVRVCASVCACDGTRNYQTYYLDVTIRTTGHCDDRFTLLCVRDRG